MAYFGLVTKIQNVRKDPNSDRLYLADCFSEGVIVGPDMKTGDLVLYLPTDGEIERWFGNEFCLFRKNEDGSVQGGYLENNGHVRAIKLRGNQSSGIVIALDRVYEKFGDQHWSDGDKVTTINDKEFCRKYIPKRKSNSTYRVKTSYKGRKAEGITYPEFSMHTDTEQLAYNFDKFREGDELNMTLKMHGTSQRSMNTYAELPNGFFRRLFHMKKRTKQAYVLGTRRCVVTENSQGYYGNDQFRMPHHEALKPHLEPGMEVFYEVVGYYGPNEENTIMPIGDNTKVNDKAFVKQFGKRSIFSYGCESGQSKMYIYRITSENGEREWTPDEITAWCDRHGFNRVPVIENFTFTTVEDLQERINKYFEDLADPIGRTHVKEGVVIRIVNRRTFTAFKSKTYEFKVIEGIIKETETAPDMEEMQEENM
jgi:hypothetical protein